MENYEQKYKEALKVIEGLYNVVKYQSSSDALLTFQTLEKAFPELKESEDEKIRKGIIKSITDLNTDWLELHGVTKENALAWLEKQGEKYLDIRYSILDKLIEADDIYQMSVNDAMIGEARNKAISALSKLEVYKSLELEKKSEQKPASEDLEEYAKKLAKGAALDKHNLIWMCKKGAEWQKQKSMQDFFEKAEKILTERMYFSDDEAKEFKNYMQDEI